MDAKQAKLVKITADQARPHVLGLLGYFEMTQTDVARAAGYYLLLVQRALGLDTFSGCSIEVVLTVRAATERLLREAGWQGEPSELWAEYDAALRERSAA